MLIVGLALLVKGADFLVDGGADFARYLKVSPLLVGLTIVAFATSLPELMVSLYSALIGEADVAVANIIGSNILNIVLIIGVGAIILPLVVKSRTLTYEFPFLIVSSFILLILGHDFFIYNQNTFILSRLDGIILLVIFAVFVYYVWNCLKKEQKESKEVKKEFSKEYQNKNSLGKNIGLMLIGLIGLVLGGKLFVSYAVKLGQLAGLSEAFIGLTVIALGTSLPELVTSVVAAWKKESDIALGNIVGSNIFNILFILGLTSVIRPLNITPNLLSQDGIFMVFIALLFLLFAAHDKKISRKEGIIFLLLYSAYFAFLVWRL